MRLDLADILPLLQSVADIEQSKFAEITREIDRLRIEILQTNDRKTKLGGQLCVQNNWEKWVADEKARINQKLALALSEHELQKQKLAKTVGKTEVLRRVVKRDC